MRNHLINEITKLAHSDERIMVITGDLGFGVLEEFRSAFPSRYINAGIAEQNMTAVATGLALEGNIVFTYSIGNFPTLRCIEQVRNDVCYHNANVIIVATGGGFPYGTLGMTHHATEDIAMMRTLPNMKVYAPSDVTEALASLHDAYRKGGPAYIRLARGKEPNYHDINSKLDVSFVVPVCNGTDIQILTTGTVLSEGIELAKLLESEALSAGVASIPRIKPICEEEIQRIAMSHKLIVTMEDHNNIGGLGGAVAEVVSGMVGIHATLLRIGLVDCFTDVIGDQDYLRDYYGISANKAIKKVIKMWEKIRG